MACIVFLGAQWGDEGKGKVVDLLARQADLIARFQGGNNAGHTLVVNGEKHILHHIPSGALYKDNVCILGRGMVIDPVVAVEEILKLKDGGYLQDDRALLIDEGAHLILPYHRRIDLAREVLKGGGKIGTTGRGIGPTYEDKYGRRGLRAGDLLDWERFSRKLRALLPEKNRELTGLLGAEAFDAAEIENVFRPLADILKPCIGNASIVIAEALDQGKNVLLEGAQGTLLDVDFGTYPFVTSSHVVAGGACTGIGIGPTAIDQVIGISKAYTTRVGSGPFPTELHDQTGQQLREIGQEFGSTTGRPRRCGWLDGVALKHAVRVNGLSGLAITKLDVLTGLPLLKVCTAYRIGERRVEHFPTDLETLEKCEPLYEEMPGWTEDVTAACCLEDLPLNARKYLQWISDFTGIEIPLLSLGPGRSETIVIHNPFL